MLKRFSVLGLILVCLPVLHAVEFVSPNGDVVLHCDLTEPEGKLVYRVVYRGIPLLTDSQLGWVLAEDRLVNQGFRLLEHQTSEIDQTWKPVYGERSEVRDHYRELTLTLACSSMSEIQIKLIFRCYNEGVAFCYQFDSVEKIDSVVIEQELTEFRFLKNHLAWATLKAQGKYQQKPLSTIKSPVERPLTVKASEDCYVAVGEARLVDYARMLLQRVDEGYGVRTVLSSPVDVSLPYTTPWRVIMVADGPGQLLENNDIFLNLNEPCAIEDTSWIKPGKVIREVTLTTTGAKVCVDFAVERQLQYVEFDAGWYGYEYDDASDATTVTLDPRRSRGPFDLHEVIRYAEARGIGVLVYVNRRALEKQLDTILPLFQQWGIKGVKYGFVRVGSQEWTTWLHEAVRKAAEHQLMVDIHDEYRPTGYSRTYPNLMTQEGIRGDEAKPSNENTLVILFTRMLAGAGDHTICYFWEDITNRHTHAYQLAKAVCIYSPWQFLYWYDCPSRMPGGRGGEIKASPELAFFDQVPTVWDETRVLHGSIGEFAVIARRSGDDWFIGAMNNQIARSLEIDFSFLKLGQTYEATIYRDDPTLNTVTKVAIDQCEVNSNTKRLIKLMSNGGQAWHLRLQSK